jgi:urea ABC transporter urea binding protein
VARTTTIFGLVAVVLGGLAAAVWLGLGRPGAEPIVVGILHSQTGPMAASETAVIEATVLALDEVNRAGGVLGHPVRWVLADGASDEITFAREAERLIVQERVQAVFGCWTSASRKAVREVVERHDHLLFYPVQYEGCEASPNVVYLGASPNQQIIPAVAWGLETQGRRVALIGSDYVFPRVANAIIRDQLQALQGKLVAEVYVPLGASAGQVKDAMDVIRQARPDVVLNTINGAANTPFFQCMSRLAPDSEREPAVISFSLAEPEIQALGEAVRPVGQFAAWNYFQSISRPENRAFVDAFRTRYGAERVVSDPMEAAHCGVALWARAVAEAGTAEVGPVRLVLRQQSMNAPEGIVSIDPENQHAWKTVRIGRVQPDGQFAIVWDSGRPVPPIPFPITRARSEWESLLNDFYRSWGGRWSNPSGRVEIIAPATEGAPRSVPSLAPKPGRPPSTSVADPRPEAEDLPRLPPVSPGPDGPRSRSHSSPASCRTT